MTPVQTGPTISPLPTNTSQSVQVAANDAPTLYSVALAAGEVFTWSPGAASTTGSYSLYTQSGTDFFNGDINQAGAFTAQSAGTYTLAIYNNTATAATVNFTASLIPAVPPAAPLSFDAGTLPSNAASSINTSFTAGNQVATQSFDVTKVGSGRSGHRPPALGSQAR